MTGCVRCFAMSCTKTFRKALGHSLLGIRFLVEKENEDEFRKKKIRILTMHSVDAT